jgi:hypothetical protein
VQEEEEMEEFPLVVAGRTLPDALDRIRRYCGLAWSGGPPETWAWHYYDAVPTEQDDHVTAVDVLCAAALHPGLGRADLAFFRERHTELSAWLRDMPQDSRLWETSDEVVEHLASLPERFPKVSVSLLSKVLHRKRPHLIPLLDRHVVDWYRPVTGKRVMAQAWGSIIRAMREDELDGERRLLYAIAFSEIEQELWSGTDADDRPRLSWIRAIDIAIWMGSR